MVIGKIVIFDKKHDVLDIIKKSGYTINQHKDYYELAKNDKHFNSLQNIKIVYNSLSFLEIKQFTYITVCKFHGNINYSSIFNNNIKYLSDECKLTEVNKLEDYCNLLFLGIGNKEYEKIVKSQFSKKIEIVNNEYEELKKHDENVYKQLLPYNKSENLDKNGKSSETVYNKRMSEKLKLILTDRDTNNIWNIEKSDLYDENKQVLYHNGKTNKVRVLCMQVINSAKYISSNIEQKDCEKFKNIKSYVIGLIADSNVTNNHIYSLTACAKIVKEFFNYDVYINIVEYKE